MRNVGKKSAGKPQTTGFDPTAPSVHPVCGACRVGRLEPFKFRFNTQGESYSYAACENCGVRWFILEDGTPAYIMKDDEV